MLLHVWERMKPRTGPDGQPVAEPSLAEWLNASHHNIRKQLNRLAFEAHRDQATASADERVPSGAAPIPKAALLLALSRASDQFPDTKLLRLEEYLRDRAGILAEHGAGVYQFPHRSFQEYLAACHLTDDDFPDQLAGLVRQAPERWPRWVTRGPRWAAWPACSSAGCLRGPSRWVTSAARSRRSQERPWSWASPMRWAATR